MAEVVAMGAGELLARKFAFEVAKQGLFSVTSYVRDQYFQPKIDSYKKRTALEREVSDLKDAKNNLISDPVGAIVSLSRFSQGDIFRFTAGAFKQAYNIYKRQQKRPGKAQKKTNERLYFPAEKVEPINIDQHALQTEKMLDMLDKELGFINEALANELSFETESNREVVENAKLSKKRTVDEKGSGFSDKDDITEEDERFLLFLPFLSEDRNLTKEEFKYVKTMGKLEAFKSALKTGAYLRASAKYRPV